MKILVHTFWLSPYRGSEFAVAWDYITTMSKYHELFVICGSSSYTLGDFSDLDRWLDNNTFENVTFLKIKPSQMSLVCNLAYKYHLSYYSFYFAYKQWEKEAYKVITKSSIIANIDLIHFVGPVGYREPGYLWKLPKPYIWGPIGGFENINWNLLIHLKGNRLRLLFRNIINPIQYYTNIRVRKAMKNANVVIACTHGNVNKIRKVYGKEVLYLPENGIKLINRSVVSCSEKEKLNILWIGTMEARKMPNIVLDVVLKMKEVSHVVFHMIGGGPLLPWFRNSIQKHGLEANFVVYGQVPRERIFNLLPDFDIHIITSLLEANTTVIWETMSWGIPTISLDHFGMADVINDSCGIKIPVKSYGQVVNCLAATLDNLSLNPEKILQLKKGVYQSAVKYTWNNRIDFYESCYKKAIMNFTSKSK